MSENLTLDFLIGDLFKISKGKKCEVSKQSKLRYIQIDDLRNDNNLKVAAQDSKNVLCGEEDILIAWDGANAGTIGYGLKGAIGSTLAKLVPITNNVFTPYAGRFLQSKFKYLRDNCTGATIPHISKPSLINIQIPLPPLAEQQKIAAILDAADSLRQKDQQLLEHYTALSQSLFLEMFGDPVMNPMGWEKRKLGDLVTIQRGGSPRPINEFLGGKYPWIKIGDATKGDDVYINHTKEHIIEEGLHKTRLLPAGSIIFANCGVSLGFARIITFEGCIHDGWLSFSESDDKVLNKIYLLKALNSVTKYFRDTAPDGTQPNLNTSIMKNFEIILPPVNLQDKFEQCISHIISQKQQAQTNLEKSEALFSSLLHRAFTGELTQTSKAA